MALGSKSTTSIRTAVDSILREFCKYDEEREKWFAEKLRLEQEINSYKQALEDKDKEYQVLLKRYKVLELSIKNNKTSSMNSNGQDVFSENLMGLKSANIKLKLKSKRKNKQYWARTLPTSLSPQKLLGFIDDFSGRFNTNNGATTSPLIDKDEKEDKEQTGDEQKAETNKPSSQDTQKPDSTESTNSNNQSQAPHVQQEEVANNEFKLQLSPNITLRHHLDCVRSLCLNDDESVLISGSDDGTIKLWDLSKISSTSHPERLPIPITFRGHLSSVNNCCIMPNTNILITAGYDCNLYGWRLPINGSVLMEMESLSSLRLFEMKSHSDIIWDIAPNYSSPLVSSISADHTLKIYNIETQQLSLNYKFNNKLIENKYIGQTSVKWNNFQKQRLCISTISGHLLLFDVEKQCILSEIMDSKISTNYSINRIYSDDNLHSNLIYAACDDSRVRLFDVNHNKCIISQKVHTDSVTSMIIHSSSSSILTSSHDCRLRVWHFNKNNINKFSCVQDLEPQDTHPQKWNEGILCMAFNNKYKWLFSGGADGIKLYHTNL